MTDKNTNNFDLYKSNKNMYLKIQTNKIGGGSKKKSKNIRKLILRDLKKMNRQLEKQNDPKYIKKMKKKAKKQMRQLVRAKKTTDTAIIPKNIYKLDLELSGIYLEKYNKYCTTRNCLQNLLDLGYYEYQYKLKQHLSSCGVNRTTQLYGTSWLNSVLNSIIFGEHMRGRFIQILTKHITQNNKFTSIINKVHETNYTLTKKIEKDEYKIFQQIISLLYKVLCGEGIRNKNLNRYENMVTANLALSFLKQPWTTEPIQEENPNTIITKHSGFYANAAISMIIDIMNGFSDGTDKQNHADHFKFRTDIYGSETYYFGNDNHINHLNFDIYYNGTYSIYAGSYYDTFSFNNIAIKINYNNSVREFSTSSKLILDNIDNLHFIFFYYKDFKTPLKKIDDYMSCIINNDKKRFRLDSAIITYKWIDGENTGRHSISGLICKNEYYIYDQESDVYFKIDWRNLDVKNFEPYIIFAKTIGGDNLVINDIMLYPAIYYNEDIDYRYNIKECVPMRPRENKNN
uniref:Uncharacterized protein n=1 Tax=viral metagenome TaxID=1070528 RepID=A0A6C0DZ92_9ZZZZ